MYKRSISIVAAIMMLILSTGDWGGFKGVSYSEILPLEATVVVKPRFIDVQSANKDFNVTIALQDTDGSVVPITYVEEGVIITSVGDVIIPPGAITENVSARMIKGNKLTVFFNDPATGTSQDIVAAVSNLLDGSLVEVCIEGFASDMDGVLRLFDGCGAFTLRNHGNR